MEHGSLPQLSVSWDTTNLTKILSLSLYWLEDQCVNRRDWFCKIVYLLGPEGLGNSSHGMTLQTTKFPPKPSIGLKAVFKCPTSNGATKKKLTTLSNKKMR